MQLELKRSEYQGVKGIDDSYVGVNIALAQQLVYGRQQPRATGIVILLHRTGDLSAAKARLQKLFRDRSLPLEVRDFTELSPIYRQATGLYHALFVFISIVIGCVVVFSVGNAVSMSVVERTTEIGSLRALGLRRQGVRRLFLAEGAMIGVLGATLGLLLAFIIATIINRSGFTWTPPGNAQPVPIRVYLTGDPWLPTLVWIALVIVAVAASVLPAYRASRLTVVDALRHV